VKRIKYLLLEAKLLLSPTLARFLFCICQIEMVRMELSRKI